MGSSSSSQTTSSSTEYTDSFNKNLTQSLTGQSLGFSTDSGNINAQGAAYNYNSGNTTISTSNANALGAGSSAGSSASADPSSSNGADLSTYLPWILGGVALFILFKLLQK